MTTLHDRLADLADSAPQALPEPDLWGRGRRYGRRRRIGTAVIVAVTLVLLGVVVGVSELRSRSTVAPASPSSEPALPTRIVHPNVWLDGTDDAGPLGQLAAIYETPRGGWTGASYGVVGIAASTGEYRFLDLPDRAGEAVTLAPDGRRVAYWYTGETRLSPNSDSGEPIAGVAVYDTSSGEVTRLPVATDHGLSPRTLVWVDADRLVLAYSHWMGGQGDDLESRSSADGGPGLLLWAPATPGEPQALPERWGTDVRATDRAGHLLVMPDARQVFVDVDDPAAMTAGARDGSYMAGDLAVSPSGSVAWPKGNKHPNHLTVVPSGGAAYVVPNSGRTFAGVAWIDEAHVAVTRSVGRGRRVALVRVDVRTGESSVLVVYPSRAWGPQVDLATDLLAVPPVERPLPPDPMSPRLVTLLGVIVVLTGGWGFLLWRRRVRP